MYKQYIVTGSNGLLGQALRKRVRDDRNYCWATHQDLEICDNASVKSFMLKNWGWLTVHLAAYTRASQAEIERETCYHTNVVGTRNVAEYSTNMLYLSTDHIFAGTKGDYCEEDEPCPWNQYGWTKLMGEKESRQTRSTVIRCSFRPKPFPYPVAWNDSLTTVMWIDDMAEALQWCIENFNSLPPVLHIGGTKQDYHTFAETHNPVSAGPAPLQFPKDLSLDSMKYRLLREKHVS